MNDEKIVELFWQRSEAAIRETEKKYARYIHYIAERILYCREDAEECVNDTYLAAWNTIPPKRPNQLSTFLGKITRNLALDRYDKLHAEKRGAGQIDLALDELADCIPDSSSGSNIADELALSDAISKFLYTLPEQTCNIFPQVLVYEQQQRNSVSLSHQRNQCQQQSVPNPRLTERLFGERRVLYMKEKKILAVIGNIDDGLITRAGTDILPLENKSKSKFKSWMKIASAAACLCVAVIGAVVLLNPGSSTSWPTKEVPKTNLSSGESARVPKWDEMTISQQYAGVMVNGNEYSSRNCSVPSDKIGERITDATLKGYDIYTDTAYTINAVTYKISGISEACAVAVCFEGQNDYYAYVYSYYQPETLGQFIDDLSLRDTMQFGSVWYDWKKPSGDYATVEFTGLADSKVWELLLSDTTLTAVDDYDSHTFTNIMSISVDIPLLSYSNITLSVTEEGYLTTNILDTGKAFYIGKDKVEQFKDYVIKNCEGHEIVWVDDGVAIPE